MKLSSKLAVAAAAVAGLGVSAPGASAYSFTTHLTGTSSAQHTITFDGIYTASCDVSFTGATTGTTLAFDFTYSSCTFFGLPAIMAPFGSWDLLVSGGSSPNFTGQIRLPGSSAATFAVPSMGCEVYFTTPQTLSHGSGGNSITMTNVASPIGVDLGASLKLAFTTNGSCLFSAGTAEYETNGPVNISGLTINN